LNDAIFSDLDRSLTGFQGHGIFEVEYLEGQSYYRTLIGNHSQSIE